MADKPPQKLYIVSEFKNGIWRGILATYSEVDASTPLKQLGATGKIEELALRPER